VSSEEIKPEVVFIDNYLELNEYTYSISIINTTKEFVEITTPLVTVDKIRVRNCASILALQKVKNESYESIERKDEKRKNLRKQLCLEHLNKEEKKIIEEICEDFCNIFHFKKDTLTCTIAITHEITTRVDSAPVSVQPYRLPEKHKEEG